MIVHSIATEQDKRASASEESRHRRTLCFDMINVVFLPENERVAKPLSRPLTSARKQIRFCHIICHKTHAKGIASIQAAGTK
jgi:hypothetical protein